MKKLLLSQIISMAAVMAYHAAPLTGPLAPRHTFIAAAATAFTAVALAFGADSVSFLWADAANFARLDPQGISHRKLNAKYIAVIFAAVTLIAGVDLAAAFAPGAWSLIGIVPGFCAVIYYAIDPSDKPEVRRWTSVTLAVQTSAIVATILIIPSWISMIPSAIGIAFLAALYAAVSRHPRRFGLSEAPPAPCH
jgi:hypothetical protein